MSREPQTEKESPIEQREDLLSIFTKEKKSNQMLLGLEIEKLGVFRENFESIPYEGEGIRKILEELSARFTWRPTLDDGNIIGLEKEGSAITIEPGGQFELSQKPHEKIADIEAELAEHDREVASITDPMGILWLHAGIQPVTRLSRINWVPKSRYRIMRSYYEKKFTPTLEMMALTAATQANADYSSEEDARTKLHVGSALAPIVGAMMANSAVENGRLNGYCSRRLSIWRRADPDRTGIPLFFVDGSFSFEKYVDYALDVPMYFVVRDKKYLEMTHLTFRQYLGKKDGEVQPTKSDWQSHLTTLFPEVRVKSHMEFRSSDSVSASYILALMAFWKGILYDKSALSECFSRMKKFGRRDLLMALDQAAEKGLQGRIGDEQILEVARDIVAIAVSGLGRLDRVSGLNEMRYLNPIRDLLEKGKSPGEVIRQNWNVDTIRSLDDRHIRFFQRSL